LGRARRALDSLWPFLQQEPDLGDDDREHAEQLADLLARESFFRELAAIDQHTKALETAYQARLQQALDARSQAYQTPSNNSTARPAGRRSARTNATASPSRWRPTRSPRRQPSIPQLRADLDACPCVATRPSRSCCA
jgi:hypothetical protein